MSAAYEKLGAFYLGRTFDFDSQAARDEPLLLDAKDLTTHGVVFGMTGSGKTGLSIGLLEEALLDGVPVLAVDPKGDLSNLLLTFPELRGQDFEPWVDEGEARRQGVSKADFAEQQAALWKQGLGEWGQDGDRIRRLRDAADFAVYTPGSEAGLQISLLRSFRAPSAELAADGEQLRERVQATASSTLGLLGIESDPLSSREHILLAMLLDRAWREGRDLSLPDLIGQIQKPPIERVGVFDLESFYPAKERFALAMRLNNLLASPGFSSWMEGEPLDIDRMLWGSGGKPRLSIFSIAHLSDAERMFFVSTLLNETLSWMRRQEGTSSLRALLYMDEIFGYLPPSANPPSKAPLMTLMKQARAFGLGVLLATQNPKDIDYKALSNAGAWFIGRLQTDRDRDRILDGLEAAAAGSGSDFDRAEMERRIAGLGKRVFLLYNVHEDEPEAFQTRWAMSYLRGPLTRLQIERLTAQDKRESAAAGASPVASAKTVAGGSRPATPPGVQEFFAPIRTIGSADATLVYEPALAGFAHVGYVDARKKVDFARDLAVAAALEDAPTPLDWRLSEEISLAADELESDPAEAPRLEWGEPPAALAKATARRKWEKAFVSWIYADRRLAVYRSPSLKAVSNGEESERDFRIRLEQLAREERDRRIEKLRKKYGTKLRTMENKVQRSEQAVEREQAQASQQKLQSTISIGASLIGALFGRKLASATNIRRAGTALRAVGRAGKESGDIARAQETVERTRQQLADLETELEAEVEAVETALDPLNEELDTIEIRPKKTNIEVQLTAFVWLPCWRSPSGDEQPAWR